jgi:hypothetical protein
MYANHPAMAKRWQKHTPKGKKLPKHVSKSSALLTAVNYLTKKAAKSRMQKLDTMGIGPDALQAIMSQDYRSVLQKAPLLNKYKFEQEDRKRRLKEELRNPGQHLDPDVAARMFGMPQATPQGPAGAFAPPAPGTPAPPSNLLGMFGNAGTGGASLADALKGMPKMQGLKDFAMEKFANGEGGESPAEEAGEMMDPSVVEQLVNFIVSQGRGIDDEEFHQQAESLGTNPHEAEEEMYRLIAGLVGGKNDVVRGGLSAGMPTSMFPPKQIEKGREVELEHTPSPAVATEIAKDHLVEGEDYYDPRLEDLEKGMEADKEKGKIKGVGEETSKAKKNIKQKDKDVEKLKKASAWLTAGELEKAKERGISDAELRRLRMLISSEEAERVRKTLRKPKRRKKKKTRKAAFKYGFFKKIAEAGLKPSEIPGLVKAAQPRSVPGALLGGAWDVTKLIALLAFLTPTLGAPLLGAGAATAAYSLGREPTLDPEEIRHAERVALYKRLSRQAQARVKRHDEDEREAEGKTQPDDAHKKILPMNVGGGVEI